MPKRNEVIKSEEYECDECSKRETILKGEKLISWVSVNATEKENIRLFEKKKMDEPYETFHVPDKKTIVFCNRNCALKYFTNSLDLFISEVANKTAPQLKRKQV